MILTPAFSLLICDSVVASLFSLERLPSGALNQLNLPLVAPSIGFRVAEWLPQRLVLEVAELSPHSSRSE